MKNEKDKNETKEKNVILKKENKKYFYKKVKNNN